MLPSKITVTEKRIKEIQDSFFFSFSRLHLWLIESCQARGRIGAAAAAYTGACGNARCLTNWARPGIKPRSLTHWARPGIKPTSSWILSHKRNSGDPGFYSEYTPHLPSFNCHLGQTLRSLRIWIQTLPIRLKSWDLPDEGAGQTTGIWKKKQTFDFCFFCPQALWST